MKDLINKVFEEKMTNGDFEQIISAELDKQIKNIFNDLFGYNGIVKNKIRDKMQTLMSDVVEKSDFQIYVEKIKHLINESVQGSSLEQYKQIAETLEALMGRPKYDYKSVIKTSELFKTYTAWAEKIAKDNKTSIVNAFEIMEMIISDYLLELDKNNIYLVINDTSEFIDAMIKHSIKE